MGRLRDRVRRVLRCRGASPASPDAHVRGGPVIWFRALGRVVRTAFAADPLRAAVVFIVLPLMGLSQVLSAWYLKMLIDGIVHGDSGAAGMAIVAVATLIVTGHVVIVVLSKVRFTLQ